MPEFAGASKDVRKLLVMLAAVVVPVWITMRTIHAPPPWSASAPDITPLGYTVSLLIFLIPIIVVAGWHFVHPLDAEHRRAFGWAVGLIAVLGSLLDLAFGKAFFTFQNANATLGLALPGWSFETMRFEPGALPIEEFGFYLLGGMFVISLYSWADADWLKSFSVLEYEQTAQWQNRLVHVSLRSLPVWLAMLGLGLWIKTRDTAHPGIPGYFIFLMVSAFLPTFLLLRGVALFINWRAFAFAHTWLLLVSLLWEVTLAVPYEWWNYRAQHMLGVRVTPWANLPIEAIMVWVMVTWDAVIAFEVVRVWSHMKRPARSALFGK